MLDCINICNLVHIWWAKMYAWTGGTLIETCNKLYCVAELRSEKILVFLHLFARWIPKLFDDIFHYPALWFPKMIREQILRTRKYRNCFLFSGCSLTYHFDLRKTHFQIKRIEIPWLFWGFPACRNSDILFVVAVPVSFGLYIVRTRRPLSRLVRPWWWRALCEPLSSGVWALFQFSQSWASDAVSVCFIVL